MDLTGLGGILVNLYKTVKEDRDIQRWLRLAASYWFTVTIVFPFVYGSAVLAGTTQGKAIAGAMVTTSMCLFALYRSSPLAQSLMIDVPKELVEQAQDHPDTVLIAGKDAEKK